MTRAMTMDAHPSTTLPFSSAAILEMTPVPSLIIWPTPYELSGSPKGVAVFDDFFSGLITRQLKFKEEDLFHGQHQHSLFSMNTHFGVIHLFHFVFQEETLINNLETAFLLLKRKDAQTHSHRIQNILIVHEKFGDHFSFEYEDFLEFIPKDITPHFRVLP